MRRRNDEWFKNENSSCSRCQVPTRTLIDPAGPLLLSLDDDGDDVKADDDDNDGPAGPLLLSRCWDDDEVQR